MPDDNWKKDLFKFSSVPLPGGGDTHFDLWGENKTDFTVTTALPPMDDLKEVQPKIHDLGEDMSKGFSNPMDDFWKRNW